MTTYRLNNVTSSFDSDGMETFLRKQHIIKNIVPSVYTMQMLILGYYAIYHRWRGTDHLKDRIAAYISNQDYDVAAIQRLCVADLKPLYIPLQLHLTAEDRKLYEALGWFNVLAKDGTSIGIGIGR